MKDKKLRKTFCFFFFAVIVLLAVDPVVLSAQGNHQTVTGNGNKTAGRDFYDAPVSKTTTVIKAPTSKQYAAFRKIILEQDWEATKDNPAFRKLVRASNNGKNVEQVDNYSKAIFWEDLSKFLDKVEIADANYQQIKQGTVSEELKALFHQIDRARGEFNYPEVNRLLQAFREKHKELRQDFAKTDYLQGQNYELQLNYPEAERYYKKAAAIEDQDPFYLNAYAAILWITGKYAEAEPLFRRSLEIREKALGPDHPDVATGLNNLALLLKTQGKYAEAEPLYRRSLAMREKALGPEHPDVAQSLNNLAALLDTQGKYAEAEPLYRRAIAINEKSLGSSHPNTITFKNNLNELLKKLKKS